ncbi:phytoene synthase, putative [Babesia ovis]|uniref:Phytoene synthase, putative n=1 Tax=Babesia ovis TaxID=5869 RepID=A0A9W5T7M1_BABOV|nr:phytoene synthase, putative [Babesia ovis]
MRIIGISSDEQIALGYVANRSKYLLERLKAVEAMFDENVHRGIHELALTFKTMIYSILSCYKLVFGSVDANLRSHMRKTIFQFLAILKQSIEAAPKSQLLPKHLAEIKQEMQEISHSFETFGLSFAPLLQEVFGT